MLKKSIISILTIFVLWVSLSMTLHAAPNGDENFFDVFNIKKMQLKELSISGDNYDINNFQYFTLNKGFDKERIMTFASSKNIFGQGVEGVKVGVLVYQISDDEVIISYQSIKSLGASGLYSEILEFNNIGTSKVLVAVKQDNIIKHRVFQVTRKKEETKNRLENIEINFLQKEETKEKDNGGLVEKLMEKFSNFDNIPDSTK